MLDAAGEAKHGYNSYPVLYTFIALASVFTVYYGGRACLPRLGIYDQWGSARRAYSNMVVNSEDLEREEKAETDTEAMLVPLEARCCSRFSVRSSSSADAARCPPSRAVATNPACTQLATSRHRRTAFAHWIRFVALPSRS
jgi:hypothetical protein